MHYLKTTVNGNTPHFGILCIITRVEVFGPEKNDNQIKTSVSKDKLSTRLYANTDETLPILCRAAASPQLSGNCGRLKHQFTPWNSKDAKLYH